jgi:hypothetical protein
MNNWVNLPALWRIVVIGLLAGAGLPALFAIGLRALASGPHSAATTATAGSGSEDEHVVGGSPIGIGVATICFAVVLAAIGWGIYSIVNGS